MTRKLSLSLVALPVGLVVGFVLLGGGAVLILRYGIWSPRLDNRPAQIIAVMVLLGIVAGIYCTYVVYQAMPDFSEIS